MQNGFTIIGKSAPASPENYDADLGKRLAYEDAVRQAWPLEGYALRSVLDVFKEVDGSRDYLLGPVSEEKMEGVRVGKAMAMSHMRALMGLAPAQAAEGPLPSP